jgi:hypothetical protein
MRTLELSMLVRSSVHSLQTSSCDIPMRQLSWQVRCVTW